MRRHQPSSPSLSTRRPALAAITLALLQLPALAQQAAAPAGEAEAAQDSKQDKLKLNQVVVTGSSVRTTKMKQSLSVSSMDSEQIAKTGASNAAELLRSVPGLRSESTGGRGQCQRHRARRAAVGRRLALCADAGRRPARAALR